MNNSLFMTRGSCCLWALSLFYLAALCKRIYMINPATKIMAICTLGRVRIERRRRGSLELLRRRVVVYLLGMIDSSLES